MLYWSLNKSGRSLDVVTQAIFAVLGDCGNEIEIQALIAEFLDVFPLDIIFSALLNLLAFKLFLGTYEVLFFAK